MSVPSRPGNGSPLDGYGRRRYSSARWASLAYFWFPVRSDRCVHSRTSVPVVAIEFLTSLELFVAKLRLLYGMPVGVLKAQERRSARETACERSRSTRYCLPGGTRWE